MQADSQGPETAGVMRSFPIGSPGAGTFDVHEHENHLLIAFKGLLFKQKTPVLSFSIFLSLSCLVNQNIAEV